MTNSHNEWRVCVARSQTSEATVSIGNMWKSGSQRFVVSVYGRDVETSENVTVDHDTTGLPGSEWETTAS